MFGPSVPLLNGRPWLSGGALFSDGSATAPSIAFGAESSTGLFRKTTAQIGIALGGSLASYFVGNGLASANAGDAAKFLRGDGSWQTLPGGGNMLSTNNLSDVASRSTAQNNLLRDAGTGAVSISSGGTNQDLTLTPSGTGMTVINRGRATQFLEIQYSGLLRLQQGFWSANFLTCAHSAATAETTFAVAGEMSTNRTYGANLYVYSPGNNFEYIGMSFIAPGDPYLNAQTSAGRMGFRISGAECARLTTSGWFVPDGAVGTPALSFLNDTDLGIYRIGANEIGLSAGGALTASINASRLAIASGKALRLGNAYVAGAPGAATGTLTIEDSTGTVYRIPVLV